MFWKSKRDTQSVGDVKKLIQERTKTFSSHFTVHIHVITT